MEARNGPVAVCFAQQLVLTAFQLEPAVASKIGPPGIPDHPIFGSRGCDAPASNLHVVVHLVRCVFLRGAVNTFVLEEDLAHVHHELVISGKRARDRSSRVDLFHHGNLAREVPIGADAISSPGVNGPAAVPGEAVATLVHLVAFHVPGLVGHTCLVWHVIVHQVLVDHPRVTAIAARWRQALVGRRHAVHQNLPRQHHVWKFPTSHHFDAIIQRSGGTVDPTRAAVLGDVLIHITGHQIHTVHISPVKVLRQVFGFHQLVRCHLTGRRLPREQVLGAFVAMVTSCQGEQRAKTQGHQPSPRGRSRNGSLHGARLEQNWA
mmetsp:Transcript_66641/g.146068  ORF Transcript_66641/g.146068 Transcript_66641/m.146068 type:complete len:320 (+) Transcript_66641:297-1256(+)